LWLLERKTWPHGSRVPPRLPVYLGPDDLVTLTWNRTNVPRFEADAEDGRLVGVVAQADVAREADAATTGQVVEEISQ